MSERMIPYGHQLIEDDDIEAVVSALRSDFLTTGPRIASFERDLEAATGAAHAAVVNSGTAALHAAYAAAGIGPGDEIVTSPLTFAATGNAALYLGARPVFADVRADTGNLDPECVLGAITNRTKAIVPVDYTGLPADYDPLREIATARGIALIADSSHSLGATYKGRSVGTLADASTFSFHPVKTVTTGEGGAVLTDDAALNERVLTFRTHGIVHKRESFSHPERGGDWYHEMQILGFNYRMTDISAALGQSQLGKLARFIARRRQIAARYDVELASIPGLRLPAVPAGLEPAWHLYVIRVLGSTSTRRPFFERLRSRGIGVQLHYIPVYRHPYYEELGYRGGCCPVAEDFSDRAMSIPIHPGMTDHDVDRVIEAIAKTAGEILG
jgi:UDP-4-amino-4,6-dideoxy-N-acetyl-beta-L-altrosamine transaminase